MMERIAEASGRFKARIGGVFYLLVFGTGIFAVFVPGRLGSAAGLIAGACYIAVTLLFYGIFKPVIPTRLMNAASKERFLMVFFGFYCLLIGYLIFKSTFLPRILGVMIAFGGLGWLTFLSPSLASYLS